MLFSVCGPKLWNDLPNHVKRSTSTSDFMKKLNTHNCAFIYLFIYLGFYIAFDTVQVISRRVVGRAEETSTYSSSGFCTVNC